ncbi:hypothetical protein B0J11DRAFT_512057 [Dendryphion nanum]|uniref:Uncharacterized protein n=1 Tax=Dendryphion nanum TaxID=256645 RepID=A0A9P9D1N2_9PLEO|nr:hypothetical protein B0J11DRAFT_512057 [Dendryphion nanum]
MGRFEQDGSGLINLTNSLWTILKETVQDPEAGSVIIVLDALDADVILTWLETNNAAPTTDPTIFVDAVDSGPSPQRWCVLFDKLHLTQRISKIRAFAGIVRDQFIWG